MSSMRRLVVSVCLLPALVMFAGCAVGVPKSPTNVTASGATLHADVSSNVGGPVTYWFDYGTSAGYASQTPERTVGLDPNETEAVSEPIAGLSANTVYHWRVCVQDTEEDPARTVCGSDQTFEGRTVACGETITRSTWVLNDLTASGCTVTIGAANITLNLNDHSLVRIENPGFDGVMIENGAARGVFLADAASNVVRDLTVTGSGSANAIQVLGDSAGTRIADNRATAVGIALNVNASGLQVLRNVVSGIGLTSGDKEGPLLVLGDDNLIQGNNARLTNVDGVGTGVGEGSLLVYGDRNKILDNTANDSVLYGIVVGSQAADTLVRGNTADSNGQEFTFGDGIRVQSGSTSLGDNTANSNAGYGINAATGVTDLGGNSASGNGNAAQCQNVACS